MEEKWRGRSYLRDATVFIENALELVLFLIDEILQFRVEVCTERECFEVQRTVEFVSAQIAFKRRGIDLARLRSCEFEHFVRRRVKRYSRRARKA